MLCALVPILVTALVCPGALASGAPPAPEPDALLRTHVEDHGGGTAIVAVVIEPGASGPERRLYAYGENRGRPANGDTLFEIGSVTKVYTALFLADMLARGHAADGRPADHWHLDAYAPAGGLVSSAADLTDFLEVQMADPDPVWRVRPAGGGEASEPVLLGWIEGTIGEEILIWHNSGTGGFRSFVGFLPGEGRRLGWRDGMGPWRFAFTVGSAAAYTLLAVLFFA